MTIKLSPPHKFIPAGLVTEAEFFPGEPDYIRENPKKVTGARAAGLRYEKKAKEMLERRFEEREAPGEFLLGPWLTFKSGSARVRYCQPDALLIDREAGHIVIYEIKLQHTAQAWWQVRRLYQPVLEFIFEGYNFTAMELVKWLDPHAPFPETFYHAESPFECEKDRFGVHIFNARGGGR